MADLKIGSVLGKHLKHIVAVHTCQLNLKVTQIRDAYNNKIEELHDEHRVWDKIEALAKTANFSASKEAA